MARWIGLPEDLKNNHEMSQKTLITLNNSPETILQIAISWFNSPGLPSQELLQEEEIKKLKSQASSIQNENPSQFYKVIGKEG